MRWRGRVARRGGPDGRLRLACGAKRGGTGRVGAVGVWVVEKKLGRAWWAAEGGRRGLRSGGRPSGRGRRPSRGERAFGSGRLPSRRRGPPSGCPSRGRSRSAVRGEALAVQEASASVKVGRPAVWGVRLLPRGQRTSAVPGTFAS